MHASWLSFVENSVQENEEENVKVKLQNPHQAASISILERISDSLVYKEKECCKIMTKKASLCGSLGQKWTVWGIS